MSRSLRHLSAAAFVALSGVTAAAQTQEEAPTPAPEYRKTSLAIMATSKHFGKDWYHHNGRFYDYNEFNPGWGIEYRLSKHFHATAGVYLNSVEDISVAVVAGAETAGDKWVGVGAEAGAITGYLRFPVTPMALGYLRIGKRDHFNVRVNLMPGSIKKAAVLSLQARVPVTFERFHGHP